MKLTPSQKAAIPGFVDPTESLRHQPATAPTPDPLSPWTTERCAEFHLLEKLLYEARTINHGSSALQRIEQVIDLAQKLSECDLERENFMAFLKSQIIASRFPNHEPHC